MDRTRMRNLGPCIAALVALLLAFPAGRALAQGDLTGSIAVTVKDQDGGALPGAALTVKSSAMSLTGVTNNGGQYRFLAVPAGVYEVRATLSGFTPAVLSGVNVRFGETYTATLTLKIGATDQVTVTAAPPQIDVTLPSTRELMQQQFIQDIPLRDRNFQDLVNLLPGVVGGSVQGSRPETTGYRIDGASDVEPYLSGVALTFSQYAIDRFELVPGGFQARYGEFSGGVVNVTTRNGTNTFVGHVGYYFRDNSLVAKPPVTYPDQLHDKAPDTRRFYEAAIGGPITKDVLQYFATLEYRTADVGNVFAARTSKTDSYLGSFKLNYTPTTNDQWTVFAAANVYDTRNTIANKYVAPEFNANQTDNRALLTAQQTHIFSDSFFVESQLSYLRTNSTIKPTDPNAHVTLYEFEPDGNTRTSGRYTSNKDTSVDRARLTETFSWFLGQHEVRLGADLGYLKTTVSQIINPTRFDFRPLGNPFALHYYFYPVEYDKGGFEGAAYAQDTWKLSPRLTADIGLRVEYQKIIGNTDLAPRVGLSYDLTGDAKTKIFANWGKYVERVYDRYLEWGSQPGGQFSYVFNPEGPLADGTEVPGGSFGYRILGSNKTPYAETWTVGGERLLGSDFRVALSYTEKQLFNQLLTYSTSSPPVSYYDFRGDGKGSYKGVSLVATKRFSNSWEAQASYTWSRAEGMGSALGVFYGPTLIPPQNSIEDNDRTHVVKLSGFGQLPWGFLVSMSYSYATGLPYSIFGTDATGGSFYVGTRNSHRMSSSQSLDLSAQKRFRIGGTDVSLVAEAFNVFNHENVTAVTTGVTNHGEPTAFDVGRTFQLGVKIDF
jgi:outer membrane receptor protein involved in Fe transport